MVSSGVPPPKCDGAPDSCEVGVWRAAFVCIYLIVGIPLFALFLTQVGSYFAERSIRFHEMHVLHRPLSQSEFQYVDVLRAARGAKRIVIGADGGTDGQPSRTVTLSLSDFIVLELLRLKRMSPEELEDVKGIFDCIPGSSDDIIEPVPSISELGSTAKDLTSGQEDASRSPYPVDQKTLAAFNDLVVGIRRARSQSSAVRYVADQLSSSGGKDEGIALLQHRARIEQPEE